MAGGTQVGSLYTSLTLESQSFYVALKKAGAETERNVGLMQKSLSGLTNALKIAGAALALDQLRGVAQRALDYASSLGEVAQQLGVTTKGLQVYRYAATQVGIAQEDMDKGLAKLTLSLGKAEAGSKSQTAAFNALGISLQQISGKTADQVIPLIAEGLAKIPDPAKRAAIEVELFGKAGQKLDTLLSGGAAGVRDFSNEAERLGLVLSNEQIQNADNLADKLASLNKQLETRIAGVVADNAKSILDLANAFASLAESALKALGALARVYQLNVFKGGSIAAQGRAGTPENAAGRSLLSSSEGRKTLVDYYDSETARLQERKAARVKQGGSYLGGLVTFSQSGAASDADLKAYDRQLAVIAARRKYALDLDARAAKAESSDARLGTPVPLDLSGGLSGGRRRSAGSVDRSAERNARELLRYQRELASLQDRELSNKLALTQNEGARADLEKARLASDRESYAEELKQRIAAKELTAAQATTLQAQFDRNQQLETLAIDAQRDEELRRQGVQIASAQIDAESDDLRYKLDLARTAEERRKIEKKLLDLQYEKERIELQGIIASKDATNADVQIAQAKLDRLDLAKAQDSARIDRNNQGPLQQYLDQLPKSAAELNEAYQRVATDGLGALNQGLVDAITGAKSLGDVFKNVANQIIADLLRIALQKAIIAPLANALGGLFGGGGGGFNGLLGDAPGGGIPGLAQGGSFMAGGIGGVDRNILSVNGIPRAMVSANERISVSPSGTSGIGIRVIKGDLFDAIVGDISDSRISARAPGIASAGVAGANAARFRAKDRDLAAA